MELENRVTNEIIERIDTNLTEKASKNQLENFENFCVKTYAVKQEQTKFIEGTNAELEV